MHSGSTWFNIHKRCPLFFLPLPLQIEYYSLIQSGRSPRPHSFTMLAAFRTENSGPFLTSTKPFSLACFNGSYTPYAIHFLKFHGVIFFLTTLLNNGYLHLHCNSHILHRIASFIVKTWLVSMYSSLWNCKINVQNNWEV